MVEKYTTKIKGYYIAHGKQINRKEYHDEDTVFDSNVILSSIMLNDDYSRMMYLKCTTEENYTGEDFFSDNKAKYFYDLGVDGSIFEDPVYESWVTLLTNTLFTIVYLYVCALYIEYIKMGLEIDATTATQFIDALTHSDIP